MKQANWVRSGYVPVGEYVRAPIDEDQCIVLKPGVDFRGPAVIREWATVRPCGMFTSGWWHTDTLKRVRR